MNLSSQPHLWVFIAAFSLVLIPKAEAGIVLQANYEDSSGEGFMTRLLGRQDEMHSSMP